MVKILEYIEFFVVVVAVARHADLREEQWKPVIQSLFAVASALALYGFYQFLFQVGPQANIIDRHHIRADAVFGQPNAFGGFEAMVFPLMLALLAYGPEWGRRWWSWAGLSLAALSVIDSFSRGAWVASVGAVFFMGVVAWVARGRTMIHRGFVVPGILIPIVAFVVIDILGKTNLSHTVGVLSKNTSHVITSTIGALGNPKGHFDTRQRLRIWKDAITVIKHRPILGVGLGGFHRWMVLHPQPNLKPAPMAHNLYLEWGADLGILGVLTALWIEWSWIKNAVGVLVSKARALSPFEFALGLGAFGTIVSFVVHDWVDLLIEHGVIVPMLLALAAVWALKGRRTVKSK
jgi:O-antigen ligase